jgi:hypothetical protein
MSREDQTVTSTVQAVNDTAHPRTVRELVALVRSKDPKLSEEDVIDAVESLRHTGHIALEAPDFKSFSNFFLDFRWNFAFWSFLFVSVIAGASLSVQLNLPWGLLRLPLILLLLFYFPGRGLLRLLPRRLEFSTVEKVLLEFAASLVFVLLVGLFLNFSGLGFLAGPAIGTLILGDLIITMVASYRDYLAVRAGSERIAAKVPSFVP